MTVLQEDDIEDDDAVLISMDNADGSGQKVHRKRTRQKTTRQNIGKMSGSCQSDKLGIASLAPNSAPACRTRLSKHSSCNRVEVNTLHKHKSQIVTRTGTHQVTPKSRKNSEM